MVWIGSVMGCWGVVSQDGKRRQFFCVPISLGSSCWSCHQYLHTLAGGDGSYCILTQENSSMLLSSFGLKSTAAFVTVLCVHVHIMYGVRSEDSFVELLMVFWDQTQIIYSKCFTVWAILTVLTVLLRICFYLIEKMPIPILLCVFSKNGYRGLIFVFTCEKSQSIFPPDWLDWSVPQ